MADPKGSKEATAADIAGV
jgi:hypothetical protein